MEREKIESEIRILKLKLEKKQKELEEINKPKKIETIIIINTKTTVERLSEIMEKIKNIPRAEIKEIEHIGARKLAYEIKENDRGYFISLIWEGTTEESTQMEKYFRLTDEILKFMIIIKHEEN